MQYPIDSAPWQRNFVATLQLLARAAVRQPFGPPDPVLCGAAAVRLYTGDLWSAGCLEVFTAAPQPLITELFAAGFRWTGRPKLADRGLWHPELQIGIDVIDHVQRGLAQPTNTLSVALDLGATGPADRELVSLKVVGIEDMIVAEVAGMQRQGPSEEAAAKARVLAELGRNGVGGRLRSGYLHRRLAWETRGEIVFEDQWPDGAGEDDARSHDFAEQDAQADPCLARQAWLSFDRPRLQLPRGRREKGARKMQCHDYEWGRVGGPVVAAANVIALDVVQPPLPE